MTTEFGEVVSLECALTKGDDGRGEAHGACAMTCAKRGDPMGVMTADEIFLVVGDYTDHHNAKLFDVNLSLKCLKWCNTYNQAD